MKVDEDAIVTSIVSKLGSDDVQVLMETRFEDLIQFHSSVGRSIRNEYGLWNVDWEPELNAAGIDCSPNHPDAVSMRIIEKIWRQVRE